MMEQLHSYIEATQQSSDSTFSYLNLSSNMSEIINEEQIYPNPLEDLDSLLNGDSMDEENNPKDEKIKKKKRNRRKCDFHLKKRRKIKKNIESENHQPFNWMEDEKILHLVLELGPRFSEVQKHFTNRSLNSLKNRYYKYLRYRWDAILGNDFKHLNHTTEEPLVQINDVLNLVYQLNFFPEVTSILQKFVLRMNECFEQ